MAASIRTRWRHCLDVHPPPWKHKQLLYNKHSRTGSRSFNIEAHTHARQAAALPNSPSPSPSISLSPPFDITALTRSSLDSHLSHYPSQVISAILLQHAHTVTQTDLNHFFSVCRQHQLLPTALLLHQWVSVSAPTSTASASSATLQYRATYLNELLLLLSQRQYYDQAEHIFLSSVSPTHRLATQQDISTQAYKSTQHRASSFQSSTHKTVIPTMTTYNIMLNIYIKQGAASIAAAKDSTAPNAAARQAYSKALALCSFLRTSPLFNDPSSMPDLHFDTYTYNLIFVTYMRMKDYTMITTLQQQMSAAGIQPDAVTYGLLIDVKQRASAWTDVLTLFDQLMVYTGQQEQQAQTTTSSLSSVSSKRKSPAVKASIYCIAIQAAMTLNLHERVLDIYQQMQQLQMQLPSNSAYDQVLLALFRRGDNAGMISLWKQGEVLQVAWTRLAVELLIQAVKHTGELYVLPVILNKSLMHDVRAERLGNSALEQALYVCLLHTESPTTAPPPGHTPTTPVFVSLVGLYKERSITLTINMYIYSLSFFLQFGAWKEAINILSEMRSIHPENSFTEEQWRKTMELEMRACELAGKWQESMKCLRAMIKRNHPPPTADESSSTITDTSPTEAEEVAQDTEFFQSALVSTAALDTALTTLFHAEEWKRLLSLFLSLPVVHSDDPAALVPSEYVQYYVIHAAMELRDWEGVLNAWTHILMYEGYRQVHPAPLVKPTIDKPLNKRQARQYREDMKDEEEDHQQTTLQVYDSIMYAAYRLEQYDVCTQVFRHMLNKRLVPLAASYATQALTYSVQQQWEQMMKLITSIPEQVFQDMEIRVIEDVIQKMEERIIHLTQAQINNSTGSDSNGSTATPNTPSTADAAVTDAVSTSAAGSQLSCDLSLMRGWYNRILQFVAEQLMGFGMISTAPTHISLSPKRLYHRHHRPVPNSLPAPLFHHLPLVVRTATAVSLRYTVFGLNHTMHHNNESNIVGLIQLSIRLISHHYQQTGLACDLLVLPLNPMFTTLEIQTVLAAVTYQQQHLIGKSWYIPADGLASLFQLNSIMQQEMKEAEALELTMRGMKPGQAADKQQRHTPASISRARRYLRHTKDPSLHSKVAEADETLHTSEEKEKQPDPPVWGLLLSEEQLTGLAQSTLSKQQLQAVESKQQARVIQRQAEVEAEKIHRQKTKIGGSRTRPPFIPLRS